jgi:hypothetical protein
MQPQTAEFIYFQAAVYHENGNSQVRGLQQRLNRIR